MSSRHTFKDKKQKAMTLIVKSQDPTKDNRMVVKTVLERNTKAVDEWHRENPNFPIV
jgi:hypothetical protein